MCKNPNTAGNIYRPNCFSAIIGSAYSDIVNAKYHNGLEKYPSLYEYVYGYSGILALGYCNIIRKIQLETRADRVLFLARDGDLLQKIYLNLYPETDTEYFLWSRLAATKLCFEENTLDFIRRFVYHKYGDNFTAGELLEQMDLKELKSGCHFGNTVINEKNYRLLSGFIFDNKDKILKLYELLSTGFESKLSGCTKALAVDVGWAGSGAAAIGELCRKWGLEIEVIGVNGGMNDSFAEQPNASEGVAAIEKALFLLLSSKSQHRYIFVPRFRFGS